MMLEREAQHRDHKSYLGHLRQAQLRIRADVQDVDCRAGRGIARTTLTQLAAGDWNQRSRTPYSTASFTTPTASTSRASPNASATSRRRSMEATTNEGAPA